MTTTSLQPSRPDHQLRFSGLTFAETRAAMLLAADYIREQPEAYSVLRLRPPSAPHDRACLIGWAIHFGGAARQPDCNDAPIRSLGFYLDEGSDLLFYEACTDWHHANIGGSLFYFDPSDFGRAAAAIIHTTWEV